MLNVSKVIKLLLLLNLLIVTSGFCQTQIICKEGEYRFKWLGQFIKDGKTGYACLKSLPDSIGIVDHTGALVNTNVTWINASPIVPSIGWTNTAKVTLNSMFSGELEVQASFNSPSNETIDMSITIKVTTDLDYREYGSLADFEFDPNSISQYPTYNLLGQTGVPIKFQLNGTPDEVKTKTMPSKAFYSPSYIPNNLDFLLRPYRHLEKSDTLSINYNEILPNDTLLAYSYGCDLPAELVEFVGDSIIKTVDFVFLYDTNLTCTPKMVSCKRLIDQANDVLNKVGIYLKLGNVNPDTPKIWVAGSPPGYIDIEFDRLKEVLSPGEQFTFAEYYRNNPTENIWTHDYLVMMVEDLGQDIKEGMERKTLGRATTSSNIPEITNSFALDTEEDLNGYVFAHELLHAAYALWHPNANDPLSELGGVIVKDEKSLMYSPTNYFGEIRAYHFFKIHHIR